MLRALTHNWELKLLSLAMAFALWLFVVSGDKSQVSMAAAVEYTGLAADRLLVSQPRDTVDVQLLAARWAVPRLTADQVRVRIDLAAVDAGESVLPLSPDQVQVPSGVTVTRISPASLRVHVADADTRSLPVVPQIYGTPAPQHAIHRISVEPAAVQVRGPRAVVEQRGVVETVPVDISGARTSLKQEVGLLLPDSFYLTRERTVQVTVEIRPGPPPARRDSSQ